MNKNSIIKKTVAFARAHHEKFEGSHDWYHIQRVWQMAKKLAKKEKADGFVVQVAALLHDISDWKFSKSTSSSGKVATGFLRKIGVDEATIKQVVAIVDNVSYKGAGVKDKMTTIEGKVVQDADRLDAMGAIGIARCLYFNGGIGTGIYDPKLKPVKHKSFKHFKKKFSNAINHFYEKLLLIQGRLHTKSAKQIGRKRHQFMQEYLKHFLREWDLK